MSDRTDKWLVVSYFANIDGAAQASWVDDRIFYLRKQRIKVQLLSSFCGRKTKDFMHKRTMSISPAGFKYELGFILRRKGLKGFWLKFWEILLLFPLFPFYFLETKVLKVYGESQVLWSATAAITGLMMVVASRPSVIYSTGGPISAHLVAAFLTKVTGIQWIAELQDPLVGPGIGRSRFSRKGLAWYEKVIFKNAEKVIFCTQAAKLSAEDRHGRGKAVCIYPGAFGKMGSLPEFTKTDKCRFIHTGTFYQTRNLKYFLEGLKKAITQKPEIEKNCTVELYGHICSAEITDQISGFPYQMIKYHGIVTRQEALEAARSADILLLIQNTDSRSSLTIPCKVYDYLYFKRPVLALVYENEELKKMLEELGHLVVEADDADKICQAILQYYSRWRERDTISEYPSFEYTVEKATERLLNLATSL